MTVHGRLLPRTRSVTVTDSDQSSDRELLAAIVLNDDDALREFHRRHAPWVRARLQRRCADDDMVRDALQDTFVAVWRHAGGWDGRGEPAAWLWGIAARRLVGVHRSRQRWAPTSALEDDEATDGGGFDLALAAHLDLTQALGSLDADLAAVVRATYLDGLSINETSSLLGIPPGTVKTRIMRAKAQLRGALDER